MDDMILEQDASRLLVQIGRTVESWILDDARRRAGEKQGRGSDVVRIDAADIRKSLAEFLNQGIVVLEEVRDKAPVASRRAS